MRADQAEARLAARVEGPGGQPGARRVVGRVPGLGVRALGVPPDGVVVEVAHQVHGPAGFGRLELAVPHGLPVPLLQYPDRAALARPQVGDDRQLGARGAVLADDDLDPLRRTQPRALGGQQHPAPGLMAGEHDPEQLAGPRLAAGEEFGGLDGGNAHGISGFSGRGACRP